MSSQSSKRIGAARIFRTIRKHGTPIVEVAPMVRPSIIIPSSTVAASRPSIMRDEVGR